MNLQTSLQLYKHLSPLLPTDYADYSEPVALWSKVIENTKESVRFDDYAKCIQILLDVDLELLSAFRPEEIISQVCEELIKVDVINLVAFCKSLGL